MKDCSAPSASSPRTAADRVPRARRRSSLPPKMELRAARRRRTPSRPASANGRRTRTSSRRAARRPRTRGSDHRDGAPAHERATGATPVDRGDRAGRQPGGGIADQPRSTGQATAAAPTAGSIPDQLRAQGRKRETLVRRARARAPLLSEPPSGFRRPAAGAPFKRRARSRWSGRTRPDPKAYHAPAGSCAA